MVNGDDFYELIAGDPMDESIPAVDTLSQLRPLILGTIHPIPGLRVNLATSSS
jgi:hypothetical protein